MLSIGTRAPDFELPGIRDGERGLYRLSEYVEDGVVLLAFYPCDFSPVCTMELCSIRDIEWFDLEDDVHVFGVSQDSLYAHREFADRYDVTFPLLSDTDGSVADEYDVRYDSWEGQAGIGKRAFYAVDDARTVRYAWVTDDAYLEPDLLSVLDAVRDVTESATA